MKVSYVVLYVTDSAACQEFWTQRVGMVVKDTKEAGPHSIVKVAFADQDFSFELVPLALMQDNPHGLDLATPSIAFCVDDLEATRETLIARDVQTTEIGQVAGMDSFAFCDNEGRWFAVIRG